jgi:hypothetical protein
MQTFFVIFVYVPSGQTETHSEVLELKNSEPVQAVHYVDKPPEHLAQEASQALQTLEER